MNTVSKVIHFCNVKLSRSTRLEPSVIDYYDLTMVLSGELSYLIDGQRIALKAGDVMLLPPNTHRVRMAKNVGVHYISFNFCTEDDLTLPLLMDGVVTRELRALFSVFTPSHLSDEKRAREKAKHVTGYVLEALTDIHQRKSQNPHIRKAIDYIDEHRSEAIGLSTLAGLLHLSREYTASLFKKETGMTVSQFVNERKLCYACDLLREGGNSLSEIAKALGYENYGYFSRIFKKRFGVSPVRFKK